MEFLPLALLNNMIVSVMHIYRYFFYFFIFTMYLFD